MLCGGYDGSRRNRSLWITSGHTKRARAGRAPGAGPSAGRSVLVEVDRALDGRRAVGDRVRLRDALEGELGGLRRRVLVLGVEALGAHDHDLTGLELVVQDLLGQLVLDLPLDRAAQRPGPQHRV